MNPEQILNNLKNAAGNVNQKTLENIMGDNLYNISNMPYEQKTELLEIAAANGRYENLGILLDKFKKISLPTRILITLSQKLDCIKFTNRNHKNCFKKLLDKIIDGEIIVDINEKDEYGNTLLYYTVRYGEQEEIQKLLDLGCALGSKNKRGFMPIQDIEPDILENHLDNCIEFDEDRKKIEDKDFCLTFNYRTLIPPAEKQENNSDIENNQIEPVAETEVISYMSKDPKLKHLLKHPTIVSFLFMKWYSIRSLFYTNSICSSLFSLFLFGYIYQRYTYLNNTYYIFTSVYFTPLLIAYAIQASRVSFQIYVLRTNYFKNFENCFSAIQTCTSISIFFVRDPVDYWSKFFFSVSILLTTCKLLLEVGSHPKLSIYIEMYKIIFLNFLKILLAYSLLIVSFAFSFYVLFSGAKDNKEDCTVTKPEADFFRNPVNSVFKTIVMLTGEFELGSLKFQCSPVISKITFILFVFMVAIVLLNILTSLAVYDIERIKNDGEVAGLVAITQLVQYSDSMLPFPSKIIELYNRLCNCNPSQSLGEKHRFLESKLDYKLTVYPNKKSHIPLQRNTTRENSTNAYINLDEQAIKTTIKIIRRKKKVVKLEQQEIEDILKELANKVTLIEKKLQC